MSGWGDPPAEDPRLEEDRERERGEDDLRCCFCGSLHHDDLDCPLALKDGAMTRRQAE